MRNIIISGFSGIGKTQAAAGYKEFVIDMESNKYSKLDNGSTNPDFPKNYVETIEKEYNTGSNKVILVSCHQSVRDALHLLGVPFIIVLPNENAKNEYKIRWLARGSSIEFITKMDINWYNYLNTCKMDMAPCIYLEKDQFLVDILRRVYLHRGTKDE